MTTLAQQSAIRFVVLGDAKPAGSKRAFALRRRDGSPVLNRNGGQAVAVTDDNPKSKGWKQEVAHAARQAFQGELFRGPVRLTLTFYRPRPNGHYGTTGLNKKGRETGWPISKPDVLKLTRAVEDALTGIV